MVVLFERYGRLVELEFAPYEDGMQEIPPIDDIEVYRDDPADWVPVYVRQSAVDGPSVDLSNA